MFDLAPGGLPRGEPAADHLQIRLDRHADGRGKAVRRIAIHGEPARRIEQECTVRSNRRQTNVFNRGVLDSRQPSVVEKSQIDRIANGQGLREAQSNRKVLPIPDGRDFRSVLGNHAIHVQPVVQLKNNGLGLLARNESHPHPRIEHLGGEVDIDIDVVEFDIDQRPLGLRPRELSGEKDEGKESAVIQILLSQIGLSVSRQASARA